MSWNLFAYAVPVLDLYKSAVVNIDQGDLEKAVDSKHSEKMKKIIKEVLEKESASSYQTRIQVLRKSLPAEIGPSIHNVVAYRFKVISHGGGVWPVSLRGAGLDTSQVAGKFFISVSPDMDKVAEDALPWLTTREVGRVLAEDWLEISTLKVVATLAAVGCSVHLYGLSLLPSVGCALVANTVTHIAMSYHTEKRADDFANKHCTRGEKESAVTFLNKIDSAKTSLMKLFSRLLYPSEEIRIARIRVSIEHTTV